MPSSMALNLTETIWREDIAKEVEYLGEGARNLAEFYHRAKQQGAPPVLLDELAAVWKGLDEAKNRLQQLTTCFPPERTEQ